MFNSELTVKNSQKEIDFQCPICKQYHKINISVQELGQAKFQLKLIQKAFSHEDFGQVIILHIDWESRIRRITAYNFLDKENLDQNVSERGLLLHEEQNNVKNNLPTVNEMRNKISLTLGKPWKTGLNENSNFTFDKLINSMVKSSKRKKSL